MVIVESTRKAQLLCASLAVAGVAIAVNAGFPMLLDYMVENALADWVYWAAAGLVVVSGVFTYRVLLPGYGALGVSNRGYAPTHSIQWGCTRDGMSSCNVGSSQLGMRVAKRK